MTRGPKRVFIVEDETIVRMLLVEALGRTPGFEVVGEAADVEGLAEALLHTKPDLLLLDLILPSGDGAVVARECFRVLPTIRILVLTTREDESHIRRILQEGVQGFINKRDPLPQLLEAIGRVAEGKSSYNAKARLVLESMTLSGAPKPGSALTARELEVLRYLVNGLSQKEISARLGVSALTVKTHCQNLRRKTGVSDRVLLTRFAVDNGLV